MALLLLMIDAFSLSNTRSFERGQHAYKFVATEVFDQVVSKQTDCIALMLVLPVKRSSTMEEHCGPFRRQLCSQADSQITQCWEHANGW